MTEREWLESTDLNKLLYHAAVRFGCDRKIRLFSIACIRRVLCAYNMEVSSFLDAAEQVFDLGIGNVQHLQKLAENPEISLYQAPFHIARYSPLYSAEYILKGIQADTGWSDHGCTPVFKEIFGNPYRPVIIQATPMLREIAQHVYDSGQSAGPLADALADQCSVDDLVRHLRETEHHPKGCWVLDIILGKRM